MLDFLLAGCLDRTVHPQKCAVDTFKIVENFTVYRRQFFVEPDGSVVIGLLTSVCMQAATAVFASVDFILPSVLIAFDVLPV